MLLAPWIERDRR